MANAATTAEAGWIATMGSRVLPQLRRAGYHPVPTGRCGCIGGAGRGGTPRNGRSLPASGGYGWARTTDLSIMSAAL